MIEIILIIGVLFLILTFFYKQAICDFRINQMEWTQHDQLVELLGVLPELRDGDVAFHSQLLPCLGVFR